MLRLIDLNGSHIHLLLMARVSDATVDEHRQSDKQQNYSGKFHHSIPWSKRMSSPGVSTPNGGRVRRVAVRPAPVEVFPASHVRAGHHPWHP